MGQRMIISLIQGKHLGQSFHQKKRLFVKLSEN